MKYPITKKENITETLHGQSIEDPYRWLEDFTSDESSAWVEAQNTFSDQKLTNNEFKDKIKNGLLIKVDVIIIKIALVFFCDTC